MTGQRLYRGYALLLPSQADRDEFRRMGHDDQADVVLSMLSNSRYNPDGNSVAAQYGMGMHWSTDQWAAERWATTRTGFNPLVVGVTVTAEHPGDGHVVTDPAFLENHGVNQYGDEQEVTIKPGTTMRVVEIAWNPETYAADYVNKVVDARKTAGKMRVAKTAAWNNSPSAIPSTKYGEGYVARGLSFSGVSEVVGKKIVAGTVTARDLLGEIRSVGIWWWPMGNGVSIEDPMIYAEGMGDQDYTLKGQYEEDPEQEWWEYGEIRLVVVAKSPKRNGEWWDPEKHNPPNGLMGNSNLEDGERLEAVEIMYDAGWGWKALPAQGISVTASKTATYFMHDVNEPLVDTKDMTGFEDKASFDWVHPQIATGGALRRASDVRILQRRGVTAIVSGRRDFEDSLLTDIPVLMLPSPDDGNPKPTSWFKAAIDFCLPRLRRGEKVYIHCHAGMNRGPSLAYAVLRAYTGWDHHHAMQAIQSARSVALVGYAADADRALVELGYATKTADVDTGTFHTLTGSKVARPMRMRGPDNITVEPAVIDGRACFIVRQRGYLIAQVATPQELADIVPLDQLSGLMNIEASRAASVTYTVSYRKDPDGEPAEGGIAWVIAREGDRVVGALQWNYDADPPYVADMSVDPEYRRQGIGTAMFEKAQANESRLEHSQTLTSDGQAFVRSFAAKAAASKTASNRTVRFYHGTTSVLAEAIKQSQTFRPIPPKEISDWVAEQAGIDPQALWMSGSNYFSRSSRDGDLKTYLTTFEKVAAEYAKIGSEVFNDCLYGAARMIVGESQDSIEAQSTRDLAGKRDEWVAKFKRDHGIKPVVLTLDIPVDWLAENTYISEWKDEHGPLRGDALADRLEQHFERSHRTQDTDTWSMDRVPTRFIREIKQVAAVKTAARADALWGRDDLNQMFPDGALLTICPWPQAYRTKTGMYDKEAVRKALSDPNRDAHMDEFDPRALRAIQPSVTRQGVAYYLSDQYRQTGTTFADHGNPGNKTPVVYVRADGQQIILAGHHRAAAALLRGEPLEALRVEDPSGAGGNRLGHAQPVRRRASGSTDEGGEGLLGAGGGLGDHVGWHRRAAARVVAGGGAGAGSPGRGRAYADGADSLTALGAQGVRCYHGTSEMAWNRMLVEGFTPQPAIKMVHALEDEYGLPRGSLWKQQGWSRKRRKDGTDKHFYLTTDLGTAEGYSHAGSAPLYDALQMAFRALHPEAHRGGIFPYWAGESQWISKEITARVGRPIVVEFDIPNSVILRADETFKLLEAGWAEQRVLEWVAGRGPSPNDAELGFPPEEAQRLRQYVTRIIPGERPNIISPRRGGLEVEAGPAGGRIPAGVKARPPFGSDIFKPRPVHIGRKAGEDIADLEPDERDMVMAAIKRLERGTDRTIEAKRRPPLVGCFSLDVTGSIRVMFFLHTAGHWEVFAVTPDHNYVEVERRMRNVASLYFGCAEQTSKVASVYTVFVGWGARTPDDPARALSPDSHGRIVQVEAETDAEAHMLAAQMVNSGGTNPITALIPDGMPTSTKILSVEI